jgi:hypothetical protein
MRSKKAIYRAVIVAIACVVPLLAAGQRRTVQLPETTNVPIAEMSGVAKAAESNPATDAAFRGMFPVAFSEPLSTSDHHPVHLIVLSGTNVDPLPVSGSSAVVLGRIKDAQAFVTSDLKGLYSELVVSISSVLKQDPSSPIAAGNEIRVARAGGGIRFGHGHVEYYLVEDQGLPHVGQTYVLFLWRDNSARDYGIRTGYQIMGNRVEPLDRGPQFVRLKGALWADIEAQITARAASSSPAGTR